MRVSESDAVYDALLHKRQVYYAPSLTEPATAEGGSWVPQYSTGNSNNVVSLGPRDWRVTNTVLGPTGAIRS